MGTNLRSLFTSYQTGAHQVKTYLNLGDSGVKTDSELVYQQFHEGNKVLQTTLDKEKANELEYERKPKYHDSSISDVFETLSCSWSEIKELGSRFQRSEGSGKEELPWSKSKIRKQLKKLRKERLRRKKQR